MPSTQPVQSVLRALDIIEAVAASESGLTLSQAAEQAGLNVTTVANLARTLAIRGYISRDGARSPLKLGPAARQLVDLADGDQIASRAEAVLKRIAQEQPDCGLVYSEHDGGQVRMRIRLDPRFPGRIERPRNEAMNPYSRAQSLVFLAFGRAAVLDETLRRFPLADYADGSIRNEAQLREVLEEAAACGYVLAPADESGRFRLGVPVFDARGTLVGAMGLYHQGQPEDPDALIQTLLSAATEITGATAALPA